MGNTYLLQLKNCHVTPMKKDAKYLTHSIQINDGQLQQLKPDGGVNPKFLIEGLTVKISLNW